MIKVGDALPAATLMEFVEVEGNGCSIGPNPVKLPEAAAGKTIAVFAVPGAFTPTCSAKHVPGFVEQAEAFKAAGVDEIWCLSVNDAFVMGAWARDQKINGKGLGLRSNRYSMLVKDGKVVTLNVEGPGKFEVSDAATLLGQAKA
jgi:peroxiredoxin